MIKMLTREQLLEAREQLITLSDLAYQLRLHPLTAMTLVRKAGAGRQLSPGGEHLFYQFEVDELRDIPRRGRGRPRKD